MLTREQIMTASNAQINEWVDEYLMSHLDEWLPPQKWTEDISAAQEVVKELRGSHLYVDIRTCADFYEVWITNWATKDQTETVAHPNLPLAISRCALLTTLQP